MRNNMVAAINNIEGMKKNRTVYVTFTVLFLITVIGVYLLFILNNKTLLRFGEGNVDGLAQRYVYFFEFKRFIANLFSDGQINTWDWAIGLGADAFRFSAGSLFNPFTYFVCLFPNEHVDLGLTYAIILREYFSGIAFMIFTRKVGLNDFQILVGALSYTFSPWIIFSSTGQGQFLIATILLPLVLLGVEKVLRKESPVFFMLIVAYTVIVSFMWAYMIGIITVVYYFVRYFTVEGKTKFTEFIKKTGAFIIYGFTGIMIAGAVFISSMIKYGSSTSVSGKEVPLILSLSEYAKLPSRLFCWDHIFANYSYIGVTAFCGVMLPVIFYCIYKKKAPAIMTVLCLIMVCIPFFNSMFNFFSYMTGRWMFILAFFFSWAAAECIDKDILGNKKIKIVTIGFLLLYSLHIVVALLYMNPRQTGAITVNCIAAAVIIFMLFKMYGKDKDKSKHVQNIYKIGLVAVLVISIVTVYNIRFSYYLEEDMNMFLTRGYAAEHFDEADQKAATEIKDDGFYRVDQVELGDGTQYVQSRINEAMYYGNKSVYLFTSSIDLGWLQFNKHLGNNAGYFKRTSPVSNDNRMGIDLLMGVKYFIAGDDKVKDKLSQYAGYGFEYYDKIDGVKVLKNKYDIGLGTSYDRYIKESEWMKLSYPEREMAMLQAVVIPDDVNIKSEEVTEVTAAELRTGVKEIDYVIIAAEGVQIDEKAHKIYVENNMSEIELKVPTIYDSQLLLSITDLDRYEGDKEKSFSVHASTSKVEKSALNSMFSEQGLPDIEDYNICLGYYDEFSDSVTVTFSKKGTYSFDDIKLYSMSTDTYDEYAYELEKNRLDIDTYNTDYVKGTVDMDEDSILYVSILENYGWEVFIDGEKADPIYRTNLAFTGVEIEKGRHIVEFKYHTYGFKAGLVVSIIGIAILIFISLLYNRKKRIG